jgi:hypothetical protein
LPSTPLCFSLPFSWRSQEACQDTSPLQHCECNRIVGNLSPSGSDRLSLLELPYTPQLWGGITFSTLLACLNFSPVGIPG